MRAPILFLVVSIASILLIPTGLSAQFRQYTPPGSAADEAPSGKEAMEERMEEARWRVGPVRLDPWFGLTDAAWVQDVFAGTGQAGDEEVSDFTATVGAGLTAILPTGPNVFWTAQALPTYVWWQDLDERSQAAGSYGAGLSGYWNRLELELVARRSEDQTFQSLETSELTVLRTDLLEASAQLRMSGALWLFGGAAVRDFEDELADDDDPRAALFSRLDREETEYNGGVAWVPSDRVRVAVGVEATETEFAPGARNLSNEDTAPTLGVTVGGEDATILVDVDLALRSIEPTDGSLFPGFDELAGQARFRFRPGWRVSYEIYGMSQPVLSLFDDYSHYEERRVGLAVGVRLGREARLRVYGDTGELDYRELISSALPRTDDLTAWGASLTLPLGRVLSLETGWRQLDLDSNLPGLDRESSQVTLRFGLTTDRLLWR